MLQKILLNNNDLKRQVLAVTSLATLLNAPKLCSTFRKHLNSALATSSRVVVVIYAYGFPECGGYVFLGKNKSHWHRTELETNKQ